MRKNAKALTGILILITFISLSLAGASGYFLKQEIDKRKSLEQRLQNVQNIKMDIEKSLKMSRDEVDRLQAQIRDFDSQIAGLTSQLQTEKTDTQNLSTKIEDLSLSLKQTGLDKQELSKRLETAKQDLATREKELQDLTNLKGELQKKIKDLEARVKEGVQLGRIVVRQGADTKTKASPDILEGEIVSVNKKYEFVIINLGKKDGLFIEDILTVYKKDSPIGKIKVEKVYEKLSAANFLPQTRKDQIIKGLRVTRP